MPYTIILAAQLSTVVLAPASPSRQYSLRVVILSAVKDSRICGCLFYVVARSTALLVPRRYLFRFRKQSIHRCLSPFEVVILNVVKDPRICRCLFHAVILNAVKDPYFRCMSQAAKKQPQKRPPLPLGNYPKNKLLHPVPFFSPEKRPPTDHVLPHNPPQLHHKSTTSNHPLFAKPGSASV
jgi:hypothetical protein